MGTSIKSFARADPYNKAIFDLVDEDAGVVMSDIAVPAFTSALPSSSLSSLVSLSPVPLGSLLLDGCRC